MLDELLARLHEGMVILYALCILLYFIDFVQNDQKVNRIAFWLLAIVWVLQSSFLALYMIDTGRFPVLTIFEGLYFYAWVLVTLSLAINRMLRVDFTVFFTNILGFVIMVIHTFAPVQVHSEAISEFLRSELLVIHVTMAFISYGAFTLSFVFSLLYLIQYKWLKEKRWNKRLQRLTDLQRLETLSYWSTIIGVPMLLLSLILGLQWSVISLDGVPWFDSKIIGSFFVLLLYGWIIYLRLRKGIFGKRLAMWNSAAFLFVLINFLTTSRLSTFHVWYS
ncbi:cytochrome c biogenesis protein [Mangrovibacillus cuniculi]|uniref:Cytochrome c biogenesis protein CcsA n=1 Tax=Mangrovibacillus cuniculi TaxID=2593652 RepID=A0A7S8HFT4_9BACI|nr:cytochrome c biogenesis protein [Mangrovibacillus cuniculi]QPC47077.1 cytochrome c biogenesis protein CcsA [Mangrovibacillus cuniculi]